MADKYVKAFALRQGVVGAGESEKRLDVNKTILFLTDGSPLDRRGLTPADTDSAINAAQLAGKEESCERFCSRRGGSPILGLLSACKESVGTYTPVSRPRIF